MISDTARDFFKKEVHPVIERLEAMEEGLTLEIMKKAGDMGFLGISVPNEYGGMEFDFSRENIFVFGAESAMFWKSMALAIMYGLGVTTILTLFLLPTLYSLVEGGKEKIKLFFYSKK